MCANNGAIAPLRQQHGTIRWTTTDSSHLNVVGNSAVVLSHLRDHSSLHNPHLALLIREEQALADNNAIVSWGHHYRYDNNMADRLANIAIYSIASVYVHGTSDRRVITESAGFHDNDVSHWLETSQSEQPELQSHETTSRGLVISRQHCDVGFCKIFFLYT